MPQLQSESPVRLGLIGLGDWGHKVALAAELTPGVTIAACYARSPATCKRYSCTAYASHGEMLRYSSVESFVVKTPNPALPGLLRSASPHAAHHRRSSQICRGLTGARYLDRYAGSGTGLGRYGLQDGTPCFAPIRTRIHATGV